MLKFSRCIQSCLMFSRISRKQVLHHKNVIINPTKTIQFFSSCSSISQRQSGQSEKLNSTIRDVENDVTNLWSVNSIGRSITHATMDHATQMLKISWEDDDNVEMYPYIWLRDNCTCPSCYHPPSHSRAFLLKDMDLQVQSDSIQVEECGGQVKVVWHDGHHSMYKTDWLYSRRFSENGRNVRNRYSLKKKFWDCESLNNNYPTANFEAIMSDDISLLKWLQDIEVYGFVIVEETPTKTGQLKRLTDRISFIRKTHYGELFTVKAKHNPNNLAYAAGPLELHVDLPYYEHHPGVQFLHCIVQTEDAGGDSLLTDAFHVAHQLKKLSQQHYNILTQTQVDWLDKGTDEFGEFHKHLRSPVICTDSSGEINCIKFNNHQRDSYFPVSADKVSKWYTAMIEYYQLLNDTKYCLKFKLMPGMILTFDNLRVMHGRTSFLSAPTERHLEGCYVDWDEMRSRRIVLETKLSSHINS